MIKTIIKITVVLVLLLIAGAAYLLWNLDPVLARLKPRITEQISSAVGQEVAIGEISARLFPSAAVEVHRVSLVQAPEDASIEKLLLNTSLSELLRGKVTVSKLVIGGARVALTRNEDGSIAVGGINLTPKSGEAPEPAAGPQPSDTQPRPEEPQASADEPASTGSAPQAERQPPAEQPSPPVSPEQKDTELVFQLENAEIQDLALRWVDRAVSPEVSIALENVSADLRNFSPGEEAEFEVHGTVLSDARENLSLKGTVAVPETSLALPRSKVLIALESVNLKQVAAILEAYKALPEGLALAHELTYRTELSIDSGGIHFNPLIDAQSAQIAFKEIFSKPRDVTFRIAAQTRPGLNGNVIGDAVDINLGALELHAPFSYMPAQGTKVTLKAKQLAFSELSKFFPALSSADLGGQAAVDASVSLPPSEKGGQPELGGSIVLNNISAQAGGVPITELDANILLSKQTITAAPLKFKLAGQAFDGEVKVNGLEKPAVNYQLSAEQLALGPILTALKPDSENNSQNNLRDAVLSGLKLSGESKLLPSTGFAELTIAKSELGGATLESVSAALSYTLSPENAVQQARLSPVRIEGFGGNVTLNAELKNQTQVTAVINAEGLDLAAVSAIAAAEAGRIRLTGTLSEFNAELAAETETVPASVQGTIEGLAVDGEITGFNLLKETLNKVNQIPGVSGSLDEYIPEKYRPLFEVDDTHYQRLALKAEAREQVLELQTLSLEHEAYTLSGRGELGFDGAINLQAQLQLTPELAEEMFLKEEKLRLLADKDGSIVIPVVISKKSAGKPVVLPDVRDLLRRAAQNTATEAGRRALDRVAPGLGGALDSLLR